MNNAIYIAKTHNCAANLAGEAYLLTQDYDHILFLWANDPCIVIGRYQNPFSECNLSVMEEQGVQLVRRQSGGGAVYHDRGNLCFTLIGKKETSTKEENFAFLLDALRSLGIECEISGRNDILFNGKKISGNAFQTTTTKFCHHGTLLITSDLSVMGNYLTPSSTKLASKAVRSVASRVGNLSEAKKDINPEVIQQALIDTFCQVYGPTPITEIDFTSFAEAQENYHLFGDRDRILEKTPKFTHTIKNRFSWGEATLHLDVQNARIQEAKLFTDSLDTSLVPRIEKSLEGLVYEQAALQAAKNQCSDTNLEELLSYLIEQV